MIDRCERPTTRGFDRYGGRGIRVCERWRASFGDFLADLGPRPSKGHSLGRLNHDGHYEPGNVRWEPKTGQSKGRANPVPWMRKFLAKQKLQALLLAGGGRPLVDGVVDGERVLIAEPRIESEKALMMRIRAELSSIEGVRCWRNNVGFDQDRQVHYGLALGSADLIGVAWGRFLSLEVKRPGERPTPEQATWQRTIRRLGGVAEVVHSVEDARAAVELARPRC